LIEEFLKTISAEQSSKIDDVRKGNLKDRCLQALADAAFPEETSPDYSQVLVFQGKEMAQNL
jgi:hypothetical protein